MTDVHVTTSAGTLRGTVDDGVATFKGIPYAAPPVGERRFRPPAPAPSWTGVRDALTYGASCPQPQTRPAGWAFEAREDEDCLVLNVWTTAGDGSASTASRPVMVWIHGGGYALGSGSWPSYDGAALARRGDVVVVTVNHRLGPLGYLHLGDVVEGDEFAASGNNGMLDLVAALEWVRDEIGAFGGDAGNVTVFGESGGGSKISVLMAMPSARGLFHRAAIQSGPGLRVTKPARSTDQTRKLLAELGVAEGDTEALWSIPAERFVEAASSVGRMGFGPVLDGVVIPAHPADALADGTAMDVPVLIGCNADESAGMLPRELDEAGLRQRLASFGEDRVDEILAVYRELFPDAPPVDLLSAALTDSRMRYGSIRLAELKGTGTKTPVFQYFFTYQLGGRAGHGYEIVFVFDNIREPISHPSPSRLALADQMSEAWIAFARDGDPGHAGMPAWPAFRVPDRSTMIFGREGATVVDDPSGPARELWDRLLTRPA
jgi:para-nitrobenzyl esterase